MDGMRRKGESQTHDMSGIIVTQRENVTCEVLFTKSLVSPWSRPDAGDPEFTEDQGDGDRQEGELDENGITAVELAALHHNLAVDPLRWGFRLRWRITGILRMPYTSSCRG